MQLCARAALTAVPRLTQSINDSMKKINQTNFYNTNMLQANLRRIVVQTSQSWLLFDVRIYIPKGLLLSLLTPVIWPGKDMVIVEANLSLASAVLSFCAFFTSVSTCFNDLLIWFMFFCTFSSATVLTKHHKSLFFWLHAAFNLKHFVSFTDRKSFPRWYPAVIRCGKSGDTVHWKNDAT